MSVTELKERLHEAINSIEDAEFLEAMLTIANSQPRVNDDLLTNEQLLILKEREASYLRGDSKTITLDELKTRMKNKYGF